MEKINLQQLADGIWIIFLGYFCFQILCFMREVRHVIKYIKIFNNFKITITKEVEKNKE